ncbi:hypothetical protein [Allokutzneria sp. NRRL B-24872]|uniref:hypothetical protein n=1 Tax=Allokutzneria sp. NRRL B-24872 TaxID=1137961 RepID=UPI000A3852E4|nr:hypothetical protein [Allokutzneria sp. NRRL B-24872]
MGSLREVAHAVLAALALLPVQKLCVAEEALDSAAALWLENTDGSTDPAADDVHALLHVALDDLHNARHLAETTIPEAVGEFLSRLGTTTTIPPRHVRTHPSPPRHVTASGA